MKIICVGRNYIDHIYELDNPKPSEPVFFLKPDSSVLKKNQPFFIPEFSNEIHFEVELLVKINRLGKHIQEKFAHKYYSHVGVGIDFTARDIQKKLKKQGLPWEKAKSFDQSAVISEFLPLSDFDNIQNIEFSLKHNNDLVQKVNSQQMLFSVDFLISYISKYITLKIGDIIFTGTPAGVSRVNKNDILFAFIEKKKLLEVNIK